MKLGELRDLIRAEANIEGVREYQNLIDNIINQELQRMTGLAKFPELQTSVNTTLTVGQSILDLPNDFQQLATLFYTKLGDTKAKELELSKCIYSVDDRFLTPRYYTRVSTGYTLFPYAGISAGDTTLLVYYYKPELLLDTDELQIPALETAIIQFTMGRMLRMKDTRKAQFATSEGNKAFMQARALVNADK